MNLGVESGGLSFSCIIPSGTRIPTEKPFECAFYTSVDYQTQLSFNIFEGDSFCVLFNKMIGNLIVPNITLELAGKICEKCKEPCKECDINGNCLDCIDVLIFAVHNGYWPKKAYSFTKEIFNISDIMKDDQIFIKREESQCYIIYLNNQILTKQNLEPSKDLASLRNLLSLQINEKAYFINAITKERINNEDEQFQLLSKISNNNNEIFMEQEVEIKKKVTEVIKGSELIDQIGQLKIYKYNCVPQKYVDELIEKKNKKL